MYDGVISGERVRTERPDDLVSGDWLRLCRRFDPLFETTDLSLDPSAIGELETLARIHDLDEGMPRADLWRTLRLLLAPPMARV